MQCGRRQVPGKSLLRRVRSSLLVLPAQPEGLGGGTAGLQPPARLVLPWCCLPPARPGKGQWDQSHGAAPKTVQGRVLQFLQVLPQLCTESLLLQVTAQSREGKAGFGNELGFILKSLKCSGKVFFHFTMKAWDARVLQQKTREGINT